MEITLTNEEIRILGCLIEKEMATPEYYPLSMNALMNACNQKSNRDPVVSWDEGIVNGFLEMLKEKELVFQSNLSRVPKYEENYTKNNNLNPPEAAILCILMLRGPQTAGEIRGRSERLFAFENLGMVNTTLEDLILRAQVIRLPRQPGRKEVRYCHTLGSMGEGLPAEEVASESKGVLTELETDRIKELEEKVDSLISELALLKKEFAEFRRELQR